MLHFHGCHTVTSLLEKAGVKIKPRGKRIVEVSVVSLIGTSGGDLQHLGAESSGAIGCL